jgi:tetratricopeptide (TPR) repeat protein
MTRRRRGDAALPPLPLELAYPLEVRGAGMEGTAVLDELPARSALVVLKALRLVYAWSRGPELAGALLRRGELEDFEKEIVASGLEDGLWEPLVAIVAELRCPAAARTGALGLGCFALSEWALGAGAESTALLFAEAAALAWPEHARYAWIVGRMLRNHGRFREAELWLRRAARVAVWYEDWETQNLALNSLGNLYVQQGAYGDALRYLTRALSLARRQKMRDREGAVTHDLFLLSIYTGKHIEAEKLAVAAFSLYGCEHPNLLKLAHDVAYLWSEQGRFSLALSVLRALRRFFELPQDRLLVLGAMARAAGACGDDELFTQCWNEAWTIVHTLNPEAHANVSAGLLYLGLGAAGLSQWGRATDALTQALDAARNRQAHDDVLKAESALEMVCRHEWVEHARRTSPGAASARLAEAFVRSLEQKCLEPGTMESPVCGDVT